jgi:hypothetical protein
MSEQLYLKNTFSSTLGKEFTWQVKRVTENYEQAKPIQSPLETYPRHDLIQFT